MRLPSATLTRVRRTLAALVCASGMAVSSGTLEGAQAPNPAPTPTPDVAIEIPATLPLFPLPDVVLFPDVALPLRIYEPRYRALMADALKGNRLIGMVLLQPGHEAEYEGRPPIFAVGCVGVITQEEQQPNGEYTFVLRGLQKFRVTGENPGGAYRVARITPLPEASLNASQAKEILVERQRIDKLLPPLLDALGIKPPPDNLSNEGLMIGLAQLLEFSAPEWQELLEKDGLLERLRLIAERMETFGAPGGNLARWQRNIPPVFQVRLKPDTTYY